MKSYIDNLKEQLEEIENKFSEFFKDISIQRLDDEPYSGVVFIGRNLCYDTNISNEQKKKQIYLLKLYREWTEHLKLLTHNLPKQDLKEISEIEEHLLDKINLESGWGTKATAKENISDISEKIESLRKILGVFQNDDSEVTLIPDTNALIIDPDFEKYKCIAGDTIEIVIPSTVLSELDKLKMIHKNVDFRKKVATVIKWLKGLRNQGNLTKGVTVYSSIKVKMSAKEPNFNNTLGYLDPNNNDDRIVAFTLEYSSEHPSNKVIVVTADTNLQNKLELAKLSYSEPPSKLTKNCKNKV